MLISLVDHKLHIRTKTRPEITLKSLLLVKYVFFEIFSPKVYITLQILQNTIKLKSMVMQKISDKLYFHIIANRQKKYILKSGRL